MSSNVFVASTLPISFVDRLAKTNQIKRIYLINKSHLGAYKYLQKKNPSIQLISLPTGFLKHFICIFSILLIIKIRKEKVFFFHECCWEIFDVILNILNLSSEYYPHVTLCSLKELRQKDIPLTNKVKLFLVMVNMLSKFKPYELTTDVKTKAIVWSCLRYPEKTIVHDIAKAWSVRIRAESSTVDINLKNILFVVGTELVNDDIQTRIYTNLGYELFKNGYKVFIKDHPNHESRLNVDARSWANIIDPNCPVEFLEQNFLCVIGCASTGLANFKGRAISILHMMVMEQDALESRLKHLNTLFQTGEIRYPRSEEMLLSIINTYQHRKIN